MELQRGERRYHRGPVRRLALRASAVTSERLATGIKRRLVKAATHPATAARIETVLRTLPRLPWIRPQTSPWTRSPATAWNQVEVKVPDELCTVAGILRDPAAEEEAHRRTPLHSFFALHSESMAALAPHLLATLLSVAPNLMRSTQQLVERRDEPGLHPSPSPLDPALLTAELKRRAAELGISAAGVAPYDPKYTFAEYQGRNVGDRVVVCILEQNYDSTQMIPSWRSESAALSTYAESEDRMAALAEWLRGQGYRARPETFTGESVFIHYGVAAGLGQLGQNGQLLTPQAGSRCRLIVMTTDAPLLFDEPVDYGIEGICDRCQICVRRCPVGAIPTVRKEHRGVTKAKLNTKQCLPVVTQVEGCAICMKVCPIQRYGLPAVLDEYERSGQILGKGSDDLEGYDWPLDGRHYAPGVKPRVPVKLVRPPGYAFDPARTEPPAQQRVILPGLANLMG
jgi:epoxyqueuosine reductase